MSRRREEPTQPLDTVAIAADDAALDAFTRDAVSWDVVDPALQVLVLLHEEISLELPAASTSWGSAAVDLAPHQRRGRRVGRRTVVASAITAAVLSVSGVAAAGIASGPGGALYPIHELFLGSKPTASQHAATQVRHFLGAARKHLAAHQWAATGAALHNATTWLARVNAQDRGDLPAQLAALQTQYADAVAAEPSSGSPSSGGIGGTNDRGTGGQGDNSGDNGQHSGPGPGDGSNKGSGSSGDDHGLSGDHGSPGGSGGGSGEQGDDNGGNGANSGSGKQGGGSGDNTGTDSGSHGAGSGSGSGSGDDGSGGGSGHGSDGLKSTDAGSGHSGSDG
ncbi:MAG: hypothetical protein QOF57_2289 [Frankiaceae bacterium]|nr:hypothetical protein [Frankiaceae bacterium]